MRKKIYQERLAPKGQPPHFYGLKEGMAKVRNEIFAFHTSHMSGYKIIHDTFMDTEKCAVQQISYMYESNPWIVAVKNTTFKKLFKIGYVKKKNSTSRYLLYFVAIEKYTKMGSLKEKKDEELRIDHSAQARVIILEALAFWICILCTCY